MSQTQNRRSRSRRSRTRAQKQKLDITIKVKGSISDRKTPKNNEIFQQYDFTEEGNRLFNEFMDNEQTALNETEILLESAELEKQRYGHRNFYESLVPEGETNYGVEEMCAYWEMTGWFHECDNCFENTHNGDCKCINIVSKCDMTYMDTHGRPSRTTDGTHVAFILPKIVRNVPVLTLF